MIAKRSAVIDSATFKLTEQTYDELLADTGLSLPISRTVPRPVMAKALATAPAISIP
jgi:hypothetical protein